MAATATVSGAMTSNHGQSQNFSPPETKPDIAMFHSSVPVVNGTISDQSAQHHRNDVAQKNRSVEMKREPMDTAASSSADKS